MIKSRSTWCRVRIVTPNIPGNPSRTYEWDEGGDLEGLTTVQVTQTMTGVNSFTLTFAPEGIEEGTSWAKQIPPYSLVTIEMGSSAYPDDDPLCMVGLTSPGVEDEDWIAAPPTRQVTIPGKGIERVLSECGVYKAPWLQLHGGESDALERVVRGHSVQEYTGQLSWTMEIFNAVLDPREAILRILFYFLIDHRHAVVSLLLPPPFALSDLLVPGDYTDSMMESLRRAYKPGGTLANGDFGDFDLDWIPPSWTLVDERLKVTNAAIMHKSGSVQTFMHACMDLVFHEFFTRYENGKARLIYRAKPFAQREASDEALAKGRTLFADGVPDLADLTFTSADLVKTQLRYGSDPVFNFFYVEPSSASILPNGAYRANVPPRYCGQPEDAAYLGRWGIRPLDHQTPYLPIAHRENAVDAKANMEVMDALTLILKSWYDPQPVVQQGSILLKGRPAYRPGNRLVWYGQDHAGDSDGRWDREFYLEAAQHSYQFGTGSYLTNTTVTRGWQLGGIVGPDGKRRLPTRKPRIEPPPPPPPEPEHDE